MKTTSFCTPTPACFISSQLALFLSRSIWAVDLSITRPPNKQLSVAQISSCNKFLVLFHYKPSTITIHHHENRHLLRAMGRDSGWKQGWPAGTYRRLGKDAYRLRTRPTGYDDPKI